jgi:hypothetical protein
MDDFYKDFYGSDEPQEKPPESVAQTGRPAPARQQPANDFYKDFYGDQTQKPPAGEGKAPPKQPLDTSAKQPARVPTRFQKARTAPTTPEPELTFADAASGAVKNFIPSFGGVLKAYGSAITNPQQTIAGLREIGRGVISKGASAVGVEKTLEERARDEQVLNSMIDDYAQTYGSKQGFYKALSEDPASILMDFATVASGGAGAAGKAGLISEKAALTAAKRASLIDPVQAAIATAKGAGSLTAKAARTASYVGTGVRPQYLKVATEVGRSGTPEQVELFKAMQQDPSRQREIIEMASQGLDKASQDRANQYLSGKGALSKTANVNFTEAGRKLGNLQDEFKQKMTSGPDIELNESALRTLGDIESKLISFANEPLGSSARSIYGADRLKRAIGTIRDSARGDKQSYRVASEMYNQVRDAINAADPRYMKVMEEYERMSDFLNEMRQTFGVGTKLSDTAILRRLTKADSPMQQELLESLGKYAPDLKYAIAGAATSEWVPGGIRQALLGSLPFYGFASPFAAVGHLAASSPRLAGAVALKAGQAGKYGAKATQPLVTTPLYYAGRAGEEVAGGELEPTPEKSEFAEYFGPVVPQDDTFSRMLGVESQNRQFDENGNTILGPEVQTEFGPNRAIGKAQVMPYTGPEAAKAAGLEWDENRLRTDEQYNEALGRAYYQKQLQAFGGDERLAAAAYNAGPTRVRDALKKAQESGGSYVDYLPAETQDYLRKVFGSASGGRIERRSGGRVDNVERLVGQLMLRTKQAKRETTKATEPLLDQPDESIVKALDVAQQAI